MKSTQPAPSTGNVVELHRSDNQGKSDPKSNTVASPTKVTNVKSHGTLDTDWSKKAATEMDFNVTGDLNMKLNFKVGESTVAIHLASGKELVIEMENGVKFSVPLATDNKKLA